MSTDPDIPHTSAAGLMEHVAAQIDVDAAAQRLKHGACGAFVVAGSSSSAGSPFISFCSYHEALLAETETNPLRRPLPDGIVPEDEVTRTEDRWIAIVLGMLGVMMRSSWSRA
jgi:hypothetical protein